MSSRFCSRMASRTPSRKSGTVRDVFAPQYTMSAVQISPLWGRWPSAARSDEGCHRARRNAPGRSAAPHPSSAFTPFRHLLPQGEKVESRADVPANRQRSHWRKRSGSAPPSPLVGEGGRAQRGRLRGATGRGATFQGEAPLFHTLIRRHFVQAHSPTRGEGKGEEQKRPRNKDVILVSCTMGRSHAICSTLQRGYCFPALPSAGGYAGSLPCRRLAGFRRNRARPSSPPQGLSGRVRRIRW